MLKKESLSPISSSLTSSSIDQKIITPKKIKKWIRNFEKSNIVVNAKLTTANWIIFWGLIVVLILMTLLTVIGAANTKGITGFPLYNIYWYSSFGTMVLPGIWQVVKSTLYKFKLNYSQKNFGYVLQASLVNTLLLILLGLTYWIGIKTDYYVGLKVTILVFALLEVLLIFISQFIHYRIIMTSRQQIATLK